MCGFLKCGHIFSLNIWLQSACEAVCEAITFVFNLPMSRGESKTEQIGTYSLQVHLTCILHDTCIILLKKVTFRPLSVQIKIKWAKYFKELRWPQQK